MTSEEHIRHIEIEVRCSDGESLRDIRRDYPVSLGTLARVRDGHVVEAPRLRRALRLPLYMSIKPCESCGEAHIYRPRTCQASFADRIPSDEPDRKNILNMIEVLNKAEDNYE